jgi:hypothetical protein
MVFLMHKMKQRMMRVMKVHDCNELDRLNRALGGLSEFDVSIHDECEESHIVVPIG